MTCQHHTLRLGRWYLEPIASDNSERHRIDLSHVDQSTLVQGPIGISPYSISDHLKKGTIAFDPLSTSATKKATWTTLHVRVRTKPC
ncbi:hypothetical protein BHM03_00011317 [Ensete ventricosum]|nr:hypothetical protein BHM03_00011317 [Ensete ventricosum]